MAKKKKPVKKPAARKVTQKGAPRNALGVMPLGDRILLKPLPPESITQSGIIIPETVSKEKPEQGKVVAVGSGKRDENGKVMPLSVRVGDTVMFSKYGYDEVKIKGADYYIVSESTILAIIG